jgi:hypothetical protein
VTRAVGVFVTVLGVFLVAPPGTVHLLRGVRASVRQRVLAGRSWLHRTWLGRWLKPKSARGGSTSGVVLGTFSATGTADVYSPWLPHSASVEERIEQVRKHIEQVRADVHTLRTAHSERLDALAARLDSLAADLCGEVERVQQALAEALRQGTEVEARALPVVMLGVVLSSWPQPFAWLPVWLLYPSLAGVVVLVSWLTVRAVLHEHRAGQATSSG